MRKLEEPHQEHSAQVELPLARAALSLYRCCLLLLTPQVEILSSLALAASPAERDRLSLSRL